MLTQKEISNSEFHQVMLLWNIFLCRLLFFCKVKTLLPIFFHKIQSILHSLSVFYEEIEQSDLLWIPWDFIQINLFICFCNLKILCKLKLLSTSFEVGNSLVILIFPLHFHVFLFLLVLHETRRNSTELSSQNVLLRFWYYLCNRDRLQQSTKMFLNTQSQCWAMMASTCSTK